MTCKTCGLEHRGWISCGLAKHTREMLTIAASVVANTEVANAPEVANKHGVYADKEKRKAYMRELMRKRRHRD